MPITNQSPIVSPVVQEVKPVVAPVAKPVVQEVKQSAPLKSARPAGKGGNPIAPAAAPHTVNAVPQTKLPQPPQDLYLCNAIR